MKRLRLAVLPLFLVASAASAQEDPAHNELRALKDGVLAAINSGDVDKTLTYLHPNCVVTWHNAETSRGREAVKAYNDRMTKGPGKVVESFKVNLNVDELSIIYGGDTAIAWGGTEEDFKMTDGSSFKLKGRWSATFVKENGKWLVANFHSSNNLFDNAMLDAVKKGIVMAGVAGLVVGLLVGAVVVFVLKRGKKATA